MYSDDQLIDMRENFLRNNRKGEYERLQRTGELETHLEEHAAACVRRAKSYVNQGESEVQAWQWAIRVVLLESDPD